MELNDKISYMTATNNPLSSDVIFIKGDENTWIYDVGHSDEALDAINEVKGHKNIVLSHFHADHIGNIKRLDLENRDDITLYVSKQTYKYTSFGEIVEDEISICDGVQLKIIPLPSSHSKGCLALEVDREYVFLGDAIYPTYREDRREYNSQKLKEQLDVLEGILATNFYLSHSSNKHILSKKVILMFIKSIYAKRNSHENLIVIEGMDKSLDFYEDIVKAQMGE